MKPYKGPNFRGALVKGRLKKFRKRKMLPYSWTPDGHSPIKEDTNSAFEGSSFKRIKALRKRARQLNRLANKRARLVWKRELREELKEIQSN